MCFKTPKPPASISPQADPSLSRREAQAELDASQIKAENKQTRMETTLAILNGRMGRRSLFTGGQGGAGYPGRTRSIFAGTATPPEPSLPGTPSAGGGGGPTPPSGTGDTFSRGDVMGGGTGASYRRSGVRLMKQ